MAFTFQDLFSIKDYAKNVVVIVQILSVRVNTLQASDIVVSDLSGSSGYRIHENAPDVPPDKQKQLSLYKEKLMDLANKYSKRTGTDLFEASDVDLHKSPFIDLFQKYCFVELRVRLAVGKDPKVMDVQLAKEGVQFEELWTRFRAFQGRIALDRDLLVKVVAPALRVDQYDFLLAPPSLDSTSYSSQDSSEVKIEPDIKPETEKSPSQSYAFFTAALEPLQSEAKEPVDSQIHSQIHPHTVNSQSVQFESVHSQTVPSQSVQSSSVPSSNVQSQTVHSQTVQSQTIHSPNHPPLTSLDTSSKVDSASDQALDSNNVHSSSQPFLADRQLDESQIFFHSQERRPSQTQDLLTQVPQTLDHDSQFLHISPIVSSQESHLDFNSSRVSMTIQGDFPGRKVSLSYLNRVVGGESRYKVQAKIVGTIPQDLCLVCTKSYKEVNGEVVLSDPRIRSFDIILVDSSEKKLSGQNSLAVHIPSGDVLSFFGYKHTEQLYTRMEMVKDDFGALYFTDFELEVSRSKVQSRWTLDTNFASLRTKQKT